MLLWGIPALTARFADRVFGFVSLYKSMLGIFTWLAVTGVLGASTEPRGLASCCGVLPGQIGIGASPGIGRERS
jgi:hypothetical protein